MDVVLLLLLASVIFSASLVVMMIRTPSTFLFRLIDALFSHDDPSRPR
jgi:hypothetical protein